MVPPFETFPEKIEQLLIQMRQTGHFYLQMKFTVQYVVINFHNINDMGPYIKDGSSPSGGRGQKWVKIAHLLC